MRTNEIPPSPCPSCGQTQDMATDPTGDARPRPGDLAICFHCLAVNVYGLDLHLCTPTPAERADLEASEAWPLVERCIAAARRFRIFPRGPADVRAN